MSISDNFAETLYQPLHHLHGKVYAWTAEFGAADPIRKVRDGGVDGMEYSQHRDMWRTLRGVTQEQQNKMFPS